MAFLEELITLLLNAFFKNPMPLIKGVAQVAQTPSVMVDVTPDPSITDELQDDLEAQLAGGAGTLPQ